MADKLFTVGVNVDVVVGTTYRGLYVLDGRNYEIIATPHEALDEIRKRNLRHDGGLGSVPDPYISLGPRGGGCPCCGR